MFALPHLNMHSQLFIQLILHYTVFDIFRRHSPINDVRFEKPRPQKSNQRCLPLVRCISVESTINVLQHYQ